MVDWYNFHRDVCAQYFLDNPVQVGGVGKVVEIDESKFGKRFGGVERGSKDAFMVEVNDRSAATLLPIIQRYIRPGTTVISDEWRAYSRIPTLGMAHESVNHSINFVDPLTGAHTQTIESTWSHVKKMMRKQGVDSTSEELFQTYLPDYLWRRKFKEQDPFLTIYQHIKEQYPC